MDNKDATLQLGTRPVGKLLLQYAMPAIVAMTAASLYNIVDSIFIGQGVGPLAISGLAITFPFMNLSTAFGAAVGVGASTFISMKLGQKDYKTAESILGNTVTLNLIIGIAFSVVCLLFLDPILKFFGASEATLPYARDYMVIILVGNVFSHMYFGMNAVLRAAGKPRQAMYATIVTVVMNTMLDYVFIMLFGWGIQGAAYATVLAQVMALIWQLRIFSNKQELLHFERGIYRLRSALVRNIIGVGISPFAMNVCACVVVIFINQQLVRYGSDLDVGAYGIANKVSFVFLMFVLGVNQGMQPIVGYNYGAQKIDRMIHVVKLSIIAATLIMTTGWLIAMFMPYYCARLFTKDPTLIQLGMKAIRISMVLFPLIGSQMVITFFFQSIGKVRVSIFLSLSRQLIFLLPALAVFPLFRGVDGVWYAMPFADGFAASIAAVIMLFNVKKFKKQHKELQYGEQEDDH
ncbi:MATE family efflux transporter [Segatella maculosa]|uniref:MATE family efflux transporter n=1 Tax=Segatella maculosa TaxID=439703 RepID=UPI0028D8CFB8|nr:MATE family efflux transporter [Segatella maculosa]